MKPLQLQSEAANAFKTFKAATETESGCKSGNVMADNTQELSMGEVQEVRK